MAPPETLCEETIKGVAESYAVIAIHPRDKLAVDFAVGILDLLWGFRTKLKYKKPFAIKAEYLGALVLVGIPTAIRTCTYYYPRSFRKLVLPSQLLGELLLRIA